MSELGIRHVGRKSSSDTCGELLRFNKDLWDAREVDEAMKRPTRPDPETETLQAGMASTTSSASTVLLVLLL